MAKDKEEGKDDAEEKGGSKKTLIIILVPVVLLLAAAGWFFFLKPDKSGAPEPLPHPTPGAAVTLDPITVNLAGAHFLKFGMAIQPIAGAHEVDGARALDLAINQFSQMTIEELSTAKGRSEAKKELVARIKLTYLPHGTVLSDVTSTKDSGSDSEKESESEHKEESETEAEGEHHEIDIEELPAAEAIELADSLTVQPEVYDVYFTEFVMQ
ncbi:MAG TPA: flagellar basal body-associated FliL family protein [Kineosporiaceae bacterium]|nr:flagellar basal body-associated FliL family protein [Kineosporiaceae bacterium]